MRESAGGVCQATYRGELLLDKRTNKNKTKQYKKNKKGNSD
jgi:hypothetical protein